MSGPEVQTVNDREDIEHYGFASLAEHRPGVTLWMDSSDEPCDMASGPCACGAWHTLEETEARLEAAAHQPVTGKLR